MDEMIESTTAISDDQIDALWADEDMEANADGQATEQQPEADQPKDEQPEPTQETTEDKEVPESGKTAADQPELYTIKNRDETRQVSRDELISMAQKGWDYDHIREERDQLRQYRTEADPAYELVKSYAQRNGMNVSDYLDYCRRQELMGQGINEQTANAQIAMEKQQLAFQSQQKELQEAQRRQEELAQKAQQRADAQKRDMDAFLKTYPGIKPEEIPKEVWAQVAQGQPLVSAYTMHQNQKLAAELAALKKNNENAVRTTGSLSSPASGDKKDEIDQWWYADE